MSHTNRKSALHFVFVGWDRPLGRGLDGTERSEVVYHVRSLPGGLIATGSSYEAADKRLKLLLEEAFRRAGGARAWYLAAAARLDDEDKTTFDSFLGQAARADQLTSVALSGVEFDGTTVLVGAPPSKLAGSKVA